MPYDTLNKISGVQLITGLNYVSPTDYSLYKFIVSVGLPSRETEIEFCAALFLLKLR